ncbi:hypothetical protein A8D95_24925 [Burkholderia cenocepacia]|uniref:Uncharacterized protein n=1 Tax=Burkholderia cenocepacia TaxID=95486 RepID=A0A1V2W7V8_9BURK|nr:hypothetical protein A8D83_21900 [Burkholderia cenocepacia]ONP27766.1 hypothetical protein A8D84_18535 [Burkholderia cenocepacia]ONP39353.1 hypothetical protein A8D85_15630 [Burkholderia cenocepacia]ONP50447.1 hypothetical protein A8D87_14355 [Burkholderia cenocepacia]ONP50512.1 hypothetical protein A8D86_03940 [Burkholderia cenocepacia]
MRPIAETSDEPRMEPTECNADARPTAGRAWLAAPGRGSARRRPPFVATECRSSARSAVRRTAQYGGTVPDKVAASMEYLGRCPCWRPA